MEYKLKEGDLDQGKLSWKKGHLDNLYIYI